MKWVIFLTLILVAFGCGDNKKQDPNATLVGTWTAKWKTDPASFPDVKDIKSFTMNGQITFFSDSVQINAYGFPGCIFSSDTLKHSLKWEINSDTLSFLNEDDVYGMSYRINEMLDNSIELQLMEDIFLTLKK